MSVIRFGFWLVVRGGSKLTKIYYLFFFVVQSK
jgi:hypothetical protein